MLSPIFISPTRVLITVLIMGFMAGTCSGQAYNSKVASYLAGKVGVRCGGGECAHSVIEALRVAGAEFTKRDLGADSPSPGDYVWGTLIKSFSVVNGKLKDSKPSSKLMVGDVLQYRSVRFVSGSASSSASQHTSVVAAVNSSGMPTFVYEQNFNRVRLVKKNAINLTTMTAGYIRAYRPEARVNKAGEVKFTIVNNMTSAQAVNVGVGTTVRPLMQLTAVNTGASHIYATWPTSGGAPKLVLSSKASVTIAHGGGYEIYKTSTGTAGIRKLTP